MNYLQLVNKTLDESGKELDNLTLLTWSSAEAGRKIYPKVKRWVAEAWKQILIDRNEWEFNTAELTTVVYPRLKYQSGSDTVAPVVGSEWRGANSDTVISVREVTIDGGTWLAGSAYGQIEFDVISGTNIEAGELFNEEGGLGEFEYLEKGSYDFLNVRSTVREPRWDSFVAGKGTAYPNPVVYVPWNNYVYKTYSFVGTSQSVPNFVSQDFEGKLVFYPQPLAPFTISFVYDVAPQGLVDPEDVPDKLPAEYHEWIAWRALTFLARFDKDPDLFAFADSMDTKYRRSAERNLMPIPSWADSAFNRHAY